MPGSPESKRLKARLSLSPARRIQAFVLFLVLLASALAGSLIFFYVTTPIPKWTSTIVDSSGGGVSATVGPAGDLFVGYRLVRGPTASARRRDADVNHAVPGANRKIERDIIAGNLLILRTA